jgi:hypothetical protein
MLLHNKSVNADASQAALAPHRLRSPLASGENPMVTELSHHLAVAKQHFEELSSLTSIESLERGEYGTGAKRQRIQELLWKLVTLLAAVDDIFSTHLDNNDDPPIVQLGSGHKEFYTKVLEPNSDKLRDIYLDITGLAGIRTLLEGLNPSSTKTPIGNAVGWALERWLTMLEEGELEEWLERGFKLEAAFDLVNWGFFAPDFWLENSRLLRPVLVDRPANTVPSHIQYRLREIYRAFTYGLWMSAIALSRSVAEYAIINNAPRLGIDPTYERQGKKQFKRFELLIEDVAEIRPELRVALETVRNTGNRILHPKKKRDVEVISLPKVMRDEALECVTQTRFVVESIYTTG